MAEKERYGSGQIEVADYDPAWPALFEEERARVARALGPAAIAIEHVGSTAVPGMAAKPIIDLLVTVGALAEERSRLVEALGSLGYSYLSSYEAWLPDEMLFRKIVAGRWTHHVHVMEPSSPRWEEFILIRDYLRRHPAFAAAYADVKRAMALLFEDDIVGYREAKGPFLRRVLERARADAGSAG